MRIDGAWFVCDDGGLRPIIRGKVRTADGALVETPFLLDTGADRTVFSAAILVELGLTHLDPPNELAGVGGVADSVLVETVIQLSLDVGGKAAFRGRFATFTNPTSLDMSVLGRDITNLFAGIVDRPRDVVCLLGQRHKYVIQVV